ncbi:MAG: EI24 domain-containing protein [Spirochaetota bacterium]
MPVVLHVKKPKRNLFSSLADGLRAPFDAVGYTFSNKGYYFMLMLVFFINGAILCGLVYLAFTRLYPVFSSFSPASEGWYMVIVRMITGSVITLLTLFCAVILYAFLGTLISSPLLDAFSSSTEKRLSGEKTGTGRLTYPFSEIARIFITFFRGIIAVVVAVVVLFPLNLIPFAGNLLYSVLALGAIGFFTGLPFYSYPLDRRSVESTSKMSLLWKYKWTVIGSGISFLILSFIPLLGFMSHAFTSTGAAMLFREKILPYIEFTQNTDEK